MPDEELRAKRETLLVLGLLVLGSLLIVYPFLDAILIAVAVSYILAEAHKKINPHIQDEFLSSVILISSVFAFVSIGLYFFIDNFFNILAQLNLFTGSLQERIIESLKPLNLPPTFVDNINSYLDRFSENLNEKLINIFASIPALLIDMGIFLVTSIYLYKDREKVAEKMNRTVKSLPETERKIVQNLIKSTDQIFRGVFMTQAIVALMLGGVMALGLAVIGVMTSPVPLMPLWVLFVIIASLLPLVANFMIYLPLGGYFMVFGGEPVKGMLIMVFGLVFLQILPEIFLRPYIGSKSLDEHPLIIFFGFLAGPLVLGLKGLILGPLLLILTRQFAVNYADLVSSPPGNNHSDTEE